ncbi:MAG: biotin--[acetyl-CoA-carboxylase] ligase [Ruminococcaceae bacterium]|nr:biotin--[acetyl-CoA-carboxylase] ligase [Oscillospiraceae bacterium]
MDNLISLEEVDSTNNYLKAHCELSDGTAVTARVQTAGKGRRGHSWADNGGMLPLSILLKDPPECETLTARVGLAVCAAIAEMYEIPPDIGIKWPNDVIISSHKVCGILCESMRFGASTAVICGIGINISQDENYFRDAGLPNAGSLLTLTGFAPERGSLLEAVVREVRNRAAKPFADCLDEYKRKLLNLGKSVKILGADGERAAEAVDVAPNGYLICRGENGIFEVGSGEVSVRGLNGYI